jgi:2',3'-cyclic-nucleotide 2'-phosphodiesterase (5'-nucleotidase family)
VPANILDDRDAGALTPDALKRLLTAPPTEGVAVVRITGKDLRSALNRSLSLYPRKNQGFLQLSGITVAFDPARDEDDRITDVRVGGEALKDDRVYTAAMPESLVKGGLGYFKLWDPKSAKAVTGAGGAKSTLLDVVTQRLKDSKAAPSTDGRIKGK